MSTQLQPVYDAAGANAIVNQNFQAVAPAGVYGYDAFSSSGLDWIYYGGRAFGSTVAPGGITLTASATNYIVASRSGGAVSVSTGTADWNDAKNYMRLYSVLTLPAAVFNWSDFREAYGESATDGSAMVNPMTTAGDLIFGGAPSGGVAPPTRLAASMNGYVLTLAAGVPTWAAAPGGFANPMSAAGDIIYGGAAGVASRLPKGADGQVLTLQSGVPAWVNAASGFTNPMTTVGDLIVGGTSGAAGRLAAGTLNFVLTSNGPGSAPSWKVVSGGLPNWTGAISTSSPNGSNDSATSLTPSAAGTNSDVVLKPKGSGSNLAHIPDGTAAGGDKRGSNSTDWQKVRSTSDQVASGAGAAVGGGSNNKASGTDSAVPGGSTNTASGGTSVAAGTGSVASGTTAVALGSECLADANVSQARGRQSSTKTMVGADVWASGYRAAAGDHQATRLVLRGSTSSATAQTLTSDGQSPFAFFPNELLMPSAGCLNVSGKVSAHSPASDSVKAWRFDAVLKRTAAGVVSLVSAVTPTVSAADAGASTWGVSVTADNGNKCLKVDVTGQASTSINWTCSLDACDVS